MKFMTHSEVTILDCELYCVLKPMLYPERVVLRTEKQVNCWKPFSALLQKHTQTSNKLLSKALFTHYVARWAFKWFENTAFWKSHSKHFIVLYSFTIL